MAIEATFGEYIRNLRNQNGLTLTELAAKLQLDSANLSKIENGKRDFDEKRLEKLSKAFDIDVAIIKTEFFSDLFAKKVFKNNCSIDTLSVAREKVAYLKSKSLKQAELNFDDNGF